MTIVYCIIEEPQKFKAFKSHVEFSQDDKIANENCKRKEGRTERERSP